MFAIVRAAFNQRRKTLVNALSNASELDFSKARIGEALEAMKLSPTVRGRGADPGTVRLPDEYFNIIGENICILNGE